MIEPITEIDLDYRIYNKPKDEIKDSIEYVYQVSRIKGIAFYKLILKNAINKPNEPYIRSVCNRKIAIKRLENSISYIAIIISIISLIVSFKK